MTQAAAQITASEALDRWLKACAQNPWAALSPQAAMPYAYIWRSWVRYLGDTDWTHATGLELLAFLNSIEQAKASRHAASDVTRRRYWRVIDRIYEHGQLFDYCQNNPAQEIAQADRPPQEVTSGAILTPRMWAALESGLPEPRDAVSARDRAALMAFMELGITPQELSNINLHDCAAHGLRITGPRTPQNRTLSISPELASAIQSYQGMRMLMGHSANSDALFVSREEPRISPQTMQRIATKYIRACAHRNKLPEPVQLGAQVIRNTSLLYRLLSGSPLSEVVAFAGLKSPRAFTHLRDHLPQKLRAVIATSDIAND